MPVKTGGAQTVDSSSDSSFGDVGNFNYIRATAGGEGAEACNMRNMLL